MAEEIAKGEIEEEEEVKPQKNISQRTEKVKEKFSMPIPAWQVFVVLIMMVIFIFIGMKFSGKKSKKQIVFIQIL